MKSAKFNFQHIRCKPVNDVRCAQKNQIEPAAATFSAGSDAPFPTHFLQLFTYFVKLLGGKWASANASLIRLHYSHNMLYGGWRDAQTGASSSNR